MGRESVTMAAGHQAAEERDEQLFEGRVAVVTGAGKGLGKAYSRWLARHGCAVVVNNRTHPGVPSSAQILADEIVAGGGKAIPHEGAIDDKKSATQLVELAISQYRKLDILICNAGVMPEGPFADADGDEIARLVNINLLGTIYPLQAAWRHMLAMGYGRIVLTGSTVGIYGHPQVATYGATRGAAVGLARSLTLETPANADIGINVIMPFAYTNMSARSIDEAMDQAVIETVKPDKIAPVVGWLCSEQCKHRGKIFHASASKVTRVGIVESAPVAVDPDDVTALSDALFGLEPIFEAIDSVAAVARLLGGG
jgi:NAD(P)-dependent dehydrogenase (short-subunit alcohol dehydrogenase family)